MEKVSKISVAVVGISGYAGLELARLLLRHPFVQLVAGYTSQGNFQLSDVLPEEAAVHVPVYSLDPGLNEDSGHSLLSFAKPGNLVFLATPAEVSLNWAPQLIQQGCDVIDLSGAFRLSRAAAKKWYGLNDGLRWVLDRAEYGLVPWVGPSKTGSSNAENAQVGQFSHGRLVANPGCYPTCVLMAILPLLKEGLIAPDTLVIDAKSGTTGAGRKATQNLLFSEVEGECLPYKVGQHQHYPEICEYVSERVASTIEPFFTTQLLNVRRGMIASIYAKTSGTVSLETIVSCYEGAYRDYPLAKCLALDSKSASGLSLKRVTGSPRVEIRFHLSGNQLTVFSIIDNLMKGAASQAVENLNRIFDYSLNLGLTELEGVL